MGELKEFHCMNCGADLQYRKGEKVLTCQYCGTPILIEDETGVKTAPQNAETQGSRRARAEAANQAAAFDQMGRNEAEGITYLQLRLDAASQIAEAKKAASSSFGWGCLFFILLLLAGLAAGGYAFWQSTTGKVLTWNGQTPLTCDATLGELGMKDKNANIQNGPALKLEQGCRLTCRHCQLKGDPALELDNNSNFNCVNCVLESEDLAVRMKSNAHFTCEDCAIRGKVGLEADGNNDIKLFGGTVDAVETAFDLSGNVELTAKNVRTKAKVGIDADGIAKVEYRGGSIEASETAIKQQSLAHIKLKDHPKITGRISAQDKKEVESMP